MNFKFKSTGLEKGFSFQSQRKAMSKNVQMSNYCIIAVILHASKVMLKILQARLQQYVNQELPDIQVAVQARFRKGSETRNQIVNMYGS